MLTLMIVAVIVVFLAVITTAIFDFHRAACAVYAANLHLLGFECRYLSHMCAELILSDYRPKS
jgi:hypothetical protein